MTTDCSAASLVAKQATTKTIKKPDGTCHPLKTHVVPMCVLKIADYEYAVYFSSTLKLSPVQSRVSSNVYH